MSWGLLTRAWSGIGDQGIVWVALCHGDCALGTAVSLGLLTRASSGWRCVIRTSASSGRRRVLWIADKAVVWVAPCSKRLIFKGRACTESPFLGFGAGVRRCAMGVAGGRVAWVPLCHGDCWAARPLGGAVSWGLLTRAWSGWRRVIRIGEQGVVWVAPCLRDC